MKLKLFLIINLMGIGLFAGETFGGLTYTSVDYFLGDLDFVGYSVVFQTKPVNNIFFYTDITSSILIKKDPIFESITPFLTPSLFLGMGYKIDLTKKNELSLSGGYTFFIFNSMDKDMNMGMFSSGMFLKAAYQYRLTDKYSLVIAGNIINYFQSYWYLESDYGEVSGESNSSFKAVKFFIGYSERI